MAGAGIYLPFDGSLQDLSPDSLVPLPYINNTPYTGTLSYIASPVSNQALSLKKEDQIYVKVPNHSSLNGMSKLYISVWARKRNIAATGTVLYKASQYQLRIEGTSINAFVQNEQKAAFLQRYNFTQMNDLNFHHYEISYDGQTVRLFFDGTELMQSPLTGNINTNNYSDLIIGNNHILNSPFDGDLDELVISTNARDMEAPYIIKTTPENQSVWIAPNTSVSIQAGDAYKGIDPATVQLKINNVVVTPQITGTPANYTVTYAAPVSYNFDQNINVHIRMRDVSGNELNHTFSFRIRSETDTLAPRGYFYVKDQGTTVVKIYPVLSDPETGLGQGARMKFSNDGSTWSSAVALADSYDWTVPSGTGKKTIYAQFSDAAGNWTPVWTYSIRGEPDVDFEVIKEAPTSVSIRWKSKAGVSEYRILKSNQLGWKGWISLTKNALVGDLIVKVNTTNGLRAGDCIYSSSYDYYIDEVVDSTTLRLKYPLQRALNVGDFGSDFTLSGCWVQDYGGYTEIARISNANVYIDQNLDLEKDYYYILKYGTTSYSQPVHIRLTGSELLYDVALGSNGGYAWKNTQGYGDTPELIDGNLDTAASRIQYHDPQIRFRLKTYWLGFHRINLFNKVDIRRIEISQDTSSSLVQAKVIKLGFDDRSMVELNLDVDPSIQRTVEGNYRIFRIPVSKSSTYVTVFVENVGNESGSDIRWNKIGIYTNQSPISPVTTASRLHQTNIVVDFSQTDGTLPAIFGTDEVCNDSDGYEAGWMLNSWKYTSKMFNLYRVTGGDVWPRMYGIDLIKIGELATDITAAQQTVALKNLSPVIGEIPIGCRLKIGMELTAMQARQNTIITLSPRGIEKTIPGSYSAGTPVYAYYGSGQILRMQEILPEFPVQKIMNSYKSGISSIHPTNIPLNDPSRTAVIENVRFDKGDFNVGEVLRIGREMFKVLTVVKYSTYQMLTLRRGFDGTNEPYIQHNSPVSTVYKILNYEPYYTGFKNDATNPANYFWDNLKSTMDKVILEGNAVPWIEVFSPRYCTDHRGRIRSIQSIDNSRGISNSVIVDEYNSQHDDADWWYLIFNGNTFENDAKIRGNMFEFYNAHLHILTGDAAGKIFWVRSHNGDTLRVVRTWEDSTYNVENPEYVDLIAEGVKPGDIYKISQTAEVVSSVSRKYWQYNSNLFYQMARFIVNNYSGTLNGRPFYLEFGCEPNLGQFGTWTKDSYIEAYNVLANTIRTGGPDFASGFTKNQVVIGAGAIAGGLNPGQYIAGNLGDYDFALSIIENAAPIDFVSHHRYYMGSRVQKRENSWEYWFLRNYARTLGKEIAIVDSEDSVATAGGTGKEEARHWAQYSIPYWPANFINSYCGEYGELGRLAFIIHFRLYSIKGSMGMVAYDPEFAIADREPLLDLVYWPILMYQQHTSTNPVSPDRLARVIKGSDPFNWVNAMATIHGKNGGRHVHLVNKKETPVTIQLELQGMSPGVSTVEMFTVCGGGPNQTIEDGHHPVTYAGKNGQGTIRKTTLTSLSAIVLEPFSANILCLDHSTCQNVIPQSTINEGLTALWTLDEVNGTTVTDSTTAQRTATLIGSPSVEYAWAGEGWLYLDKNNQAMVIPSATVTVQAGTLSAWIEPKDLSGLKFIFGHIYNNSNRLCLFAIGGKLAVGIGSNLMQKTDLATIVPDHQFHVALAWDQTTYSVYMNGQLLAFDTYAGLTGLNATIDIGNYGDPANRTLGFSGKFNDVRTYNRTLSFAEIREIFFTSSSPENWLTIMELPSFDLEGAPIQFSPAVIGLPRRATFDPLTYMFSWRPWYNQSGTYEMIFQTPDSNYTQRVTINVDDVLLKNWFETWIQNPGVQSAMIE